MEENFQEVPPSAVRPTTITSVAFPDERPRGGSSQAGTRLAPAGVISPISQPLCASSKDTHSSAVSDGFFSSSVRTAAVSCHDCPPFAVCSSFCPCNAKPCVGSRKNRRRTSCSPLSFFQLCPPSSVFQIALSADIQPRSPLRKKREVGKSDTWTGVQCAPASAVITA